MRKVYEIDGAFARVQPFPDGEATVLQLNVSRDVRGRGLGTKLLKWILEDADSEGVVLLLTSGIGRDSALSTEQLREWYERHGFDAIAPGGSPGTVLMQRVPRCPTCGDTGPDETYPAGDYGGGPYEANCGDEYHDQFVADGQT